MKYYITTDQDSHYYVVPLEKKDEWEAWCNLDPEQEDAWDPPNFAYAIGGCPTQIVFENWKHID